MLRPLIGWLRGRGAHVCSFRPDWLDPWDVRCWCGARPLQPRNTPPARDTTPTPQHR